MANFIAPGVYTIENDLSDYAPSINPTTIGLIGFASKGKANTATLITSPAQLIRDFGTPDTVVGGQGILGGLEILGSTNQLYYVRAEATGAAGAANFIPLGTCPYIKINPNTLHKSLAYKVVFGASSVGGVKTTTDGAASFIAYRERPGVAGAFSEGDFSWNDEFARATAGQFDTQTGPLNFSSLNSTTAYWIGAYAGSGANMEATITSATVAYTNSLSATPVDTTTLSFGVMGVAGGGAASGLIGYGHGDGDAAAGSDYAYSQGHSFEANGGGGAYVTKSMWNGQGYNYSSVATSIGTNIRGIQLKGINKNGPGTDIQVFNDGVREETFATEFLKKTVGSSYAEDLINMGVTNAKSEFIKARYYTITPTETAGSTFSADLSAVAFTPPANWGDTFTGMNRSVHVSAVGTVVAKLSPDTRVFRFPKLVNGTFNLAGGDNGDADSNSNAGNLTSAHTTGAIIGTAGARTGMYALDREDVSVNLVAVPGITAQTVQNALVTLAESTANFLALVSPPYGFSTAQQAINWSNGQASGRTAALNSSYAAIYWPWVKVYDNYSKQDKWYDPVIFALKQYAYTDAVADPWFAPAGIVRGRLTKPTDVEVKLNVGDREALYGPAAVVNPIVKFTTDGIAIYGQKTTQRAATALDRVNVRRLMIYLRKLVLASTRQLVFEPNDPITWQRIKEILNPALDDIKMRRGVTSYKVVCDSATNTALRIDRNELWCKIFIKPTKTAEVLVFELNLTSAGASV
tara:strand:+ start:343 stop:2586 length:2244 start_codon:yes stop_codon:yes gene_type:complete